MSDVLDLAPLDRSLADLDSAVSGQEAQDVLLAAGDEFAQQWKANVEDAGLVETGRYRDSIRTEPVRTTRDIASVQVFTDARNDDGFPYPAVLEYGDSEVTPSPVGIRSFDQRRRSVVRSVGEALDRKVRSRLRK